MGLLVFVFAILLSSLFVLFDDTKQKAPPIIYEESGVIEGVVKEAHRYEYNCWGSCLSLKTGDELITRCFDGGQQDFTPYIKKKIRLTYKSWIGGEAMPENKRLCKHNEVKVEEIK